MSKNQNYNTTMPPHLSNDNYLEAAEKVVENDKNISMTQLRNLLQPLSRIDNQLTANRNITTDIKNQLTYIELRIVYAAARDAKVMNFVKRAKLRDYIRDASKSYDAFKLYHHYFEAIVAFAKYKETSQKLKTRGGI